MFKRHGVGKRYWTLKVGASGEWKKINVNELASYINAFLDVEKVQKDLKNCLKTGAAYAKMVLENYEDFFGSDEVLQSYLDVKAFSDELVKTVEKCLKREKIKVVETEKLTLYDEFEKFLDLEAEKELEGR
jgi:hypothetical protein